MTAKTIGSGSTYSAGFTITPADGNNFALTNNGVIGGTGLGFGLVAQSSGDFVYNAGKIFASTATGDGVFSVQPIRITNRSGGLINASYGVQLSGGGTLVNASGGSITGRDPIYASGTSLYVGNQGAITGTGTSNTQGGVVLSAGGYVYNKPGGSISGANGVVEGVVAKVRNEGAIVGKNAVGVMLNAGGTVTSETQTPNAAATISGAYGGISITGGVGYVLNASGQISGGVAGVFLQDGGYLHQIGGPAGEPGGGTITAAYAVAINNGSGTVETGGRILGTKLGVGMDGAGPHKVTLSSFGATISGAKAISIAGGSGYIYNRGTINGAGGTAVILPGGYNNLLEIYSGAKVYGQVNGGNFQDGPHTTTLLLAQGGASGTLTGFGSRYYNIGNVTVKSGASWTMDSSNTFIDPSFVSAGSTTFLPVTLLDAGTLTFGGSEFGRLTLGSSAHLTVSKSGVLTPAYASAAIYAATGTSAPLVVTDGQITAGGNDGIRLDDGGTVTNQADGTISAQFAGVRIQNAKGTVTNSGLIKSAITYGVALGSGGSVTNTGGTIMGTLGVGIYGGAGTVTNTGRIAGSGSNDGVLLKAGGTVNNLAGTIIGLGGIFITGGAGTVTNYGQITGTGIYSVNLSPGFANRLRIAPGASFSGNYVNGGNTAGAAAVSTIELLSAASAGTLNGLGSQYKFFSGITVDSGATWTIGPKGSIAAYQTLADSGTVINEVFVASEVTLANGTFINASGYLAGDTGVAGLSGTNVVVNNSNIRATGIGVSFVTGGAVTNQSDGFIGGRLGVYIAGGPASVVNQGLIEAYLAVYLPKGGSVGNQSGGLISGRVGVVISGGNGTVTNAGTIVSVGDYGVILPDHGANRLVLDPGSTIAGLVHGGLRSASTSFSTLELASGSSAGTIGGIGAKYLNFAGLTVDAGAAWTFAAGQTIAATQVLNDDGTLTNNANVLTVVQLGAGAVLTNASGGTISGSLPVLAPEGLAGPVTVVNYGLIDGTTFYGMELLSGASVTNRGGTIEGSQGLVFAGAGTVTNAGGAIIGSSGTAVLLAAGFQNRVAMSPGAVFTGKVDGGNATASGTAISTLELMSGGSAGTLSGLGSQYVHFQNFLVDPGATWTIAAGQQLPAAYALTDDGTLTNKATVLTGVTLGAGATVTNAFGATLSSASDGALALGSAATVMNLGSLGGSTLGVSLIGPSASLYNLGGTISGGVVGATISGGAGRVMNYGDGEVVGGLIGVVLSAGGTVINYGAIAGLVLGGVGISAGAGTVVNDGTIAGGGGTAVALAAGFQNLVKVDPGAVFNGVVNGGNTIGAAQVSTLELARTYELGLGNFTGTAGGLAGQYINFGQITVDAGASWLVTGNPTLGAGITLANSGALTISHGALSVAGPLYNNGLIQENAGTVTAGRLLGTGEVLIGAGSTLMASSLVGPGQTIDFAGAGLLALTPASFSGQIDGIRGGGTIELTGITDATSAGIVNGNTLAIKQSAGPTVDLTLDPAESYTGALFPIVTVGGEQFVSASGLAGPTVISQAETMGLTGAEGSTLAAVAGGLGGIIVTDAKSLLITSTDPFIVGDTGLGSLAIEGGGSVTAQAGAVIANAAAASGSFVNVSGSGSNWRIGGLLDVGVSGSGALSLSGGAAVVAGSLDAGVSAAAIGNISLSGAGTELTVAGAATVADDGTGVLSVLSGATFAAQSLTIGAQGDSSGALVVSGDGSEVNLSGALNIGTALGIGDLTVGPGAAVHASVVSLQGQVVLEGGLLDPTVQLINQGQTVGGFGTIAAGDIVDEGVIQAGANKASQKLLLVVGTVSGGGTLTVNGNQPGSNNAGILQINAGGTMELTGAVLNAATTTFTDNLTPTGTYTVNNSVVDVTFADAAGVLKLDDIAEFAGTITTFHAGDSFFITGGTLSNPAVVNGNTLTFADSGAGAGAGGIDSIIFGSQISAGGFNIVNNNVQVVACFAEGTRIETESGPVAVETLSVGQRVLTHDGPQEPIVWIGQRTVRCDRHPKPETVWPVRVRAGALGENVPVRDLYLSPDHAVFVNDVLVPVRLLINGTSITQVKRDRVRYFHVELPRHAVILAEGLTVESYLDTGDRMDFEQGGVMRLFPDFGAARRPDAAWIWETKGAARLIMMGRKLREARSVVSDDTVTRFRSKRSGTR